MSMKQPEARETSPRVQKSNLTDVGFSPEEKKQIEDAALQLFGIINAVRDERPMPEATTCTVELGWDGGPVAKVSCTFDI
ncbi:hypothetical protein ACFVYC_13595 [Pseudarthrobacter sp. NPDC058329]|uniref:hypothetical protein n=1 Tax=Pseudarthrobacter sp. NPDC058329 TaxID=3346448 RepID=UPI0036DAFD6B